MITKLDIKRYGGWYHRIHKRLVREFGEDAELFADLLAATSPRVSVAKNWRAAKALYECRLASGTINPDLVAMKTHLPNVIRAFNREPLSGQKVQRFAANLKGDYDAVTIDVWMCKYFDIDHTKLTPKLYNKLEQKVRSYANEFDCTPCEYQAAAWVVTRIKAGRRFKSFLTVAENDGQLTFGDW